ncbi:hypothetical protein BG842_09740 [Haladaptatus sp. W1]|nr:hypothetical protein BG842_09740 [Haladaptatus sp. W1]
MLGDLAVVAAARDALSSAQLFYGGRIYDYDSAYEMAKVADTVVIGDVLHDAGIEAIKESARGVACCPESRSIYELNESSWNYRQLSILMFIIVE